jgi:hypothetical protein
MKHAIVALVALTLLAGCQADGASLEGELLVTEAGLASPVSAGTACHFRLRPAWRSGVNCQLLVTCPEPDHDLFGGRRVGGYAVCETENHAFLRADDGDVLDGDPAIALDLPSERLTWRGSREGESATLRILSMHEAEWPLE